MEDVSAWLRGKFQTAKKRLAGYWWWNLIFCSAAAEKWLSEAALADKRVALPTASGSVFGVWSARREATGVPLLTVCVLFWWEETGGDVYQPHRHAHTHLMQLSFILWEVLRCVHGCLFCVQWLLICTWDYLCTYCIYVVFEGSVNTHPHILTWDVYFVLFFFPDH